MKTVAFEMKRDKPTLFKEAQPIQPTSSRRETNEGDDERMRTKGEKRDQSSEMRRTQPPIPRQMYLLHRPQSQVRTVRKGQTILQSLPL